jgi:hypothetical protein
MSGKLGHHNPQVIYSSFENIGPMFLHTLIAHQILQQYKLLWLFTFLFNVNYILAKKYELEIKKSIDY